MKYTLHKASERGIAEHGWLHSRFSFSFADWHNPEKMGFGVLRVINDDVIDADSGFDMHPHNNMEIVTIVTKGTLTHGDSMGNHGTVNVGDVQVMSAGTGVVHSEHNNDMNESLELFQIWILPNKRNVAPRYDQESFGTEWKENALELLVSPDGRNDSLMIHQNAFIYRGTLAKETEQLYHLEQPQTNGVYLFVVEGEIEINGNILASRDAIGIVGKESLQFQAKTSTKYILFEILMS